MIRGSSRLLRLRSLLDSLVHPPTPSITFPLLYEHPIPLPSKHSVPLFPLGSSRGVEGEGKRMEGDKSEEERVKELSHLFSVSGGVFAYWKQRHLGLSVCSSNPQVPFKFFAAFGGLLHRSGGGRGAVRPHYRWSVSGKQAREVAEVLHRFPGRYEEVLRLLAALPLRLDWRSPPIQYLLKSLASLAFTFSPSGCVNSWRDLSELVDSYGHVICDRTTRRVRIQLVHPNERLLESVVSFLRPLVPGSMKVPRVRGGTSKSCSSPRFCWMSQNSRFTVFIIENLLRNGLVLQKRRAEDAVKVLLSGEFSSIPSQSNHLMYRKLDGGGYEIAHIIVKLRIVKIQKARRLKKRRNGGWEEVEEVEDKLRKMTALKRTLDCESQVSKIRVDIRSLLRGGASVMKG